MTHKDAKAVLDFWFDEDHVARQFAEEPEFDEMIREKFLEIWEKGAEGLLVDWREDAPGRLAEIIVLDQFSRNLFRRDIRTYTQDKMAIVLAQELIKQPDFEALPDEWKKFALLPFMHSESLDLHQWARPLFEAGDEGTLYFEDLHLNVLKRFGRYPYQNQDLGRQNTPEEEAYMREKDGRYYSE
ncbi:MAG: DUF924 domain-containing protein [Tissierellia bacterium]|nr:DUF924 domain-containing protein [Tissierellia bacterium]